MSRKLNKLVKNQQETTRKQKHMQELEKYIHNKSQTKLTANEISVLAKGFSLVPTPTRVYIKQIMEDVGQYAAKMRAALFYAHSNKIRKENIFKVPGQAPEIPSENVGLENYITATRVHIGDIIQEHIEKPIKPKYNVTKQELKAVKDLCKRDDIVIKKPDKGSGVAIQSREDYVKEGNRQLLTGDYYTPSSMEEYLNSIQLLDEQLKKMMDDNEISLELYLEMTPKNKSSVKIPHLYHIPKIHKEDTELGTWKGRAILSACAGPGTKVSQYIDTFIQPIVQRQSTYLKDTGELINILEELKLPPNTIMCTADITSMYTNISHPDVIRILEEVLPKHGHILTRFKKPSVKNLVKLIEIHIKNNIFYFDGKLYKQTFGLPMGLRASPGLADLLVYYYEKTLVDAHREQLLLYKRFRDDVLMFWISTELTFLVFQAKLNKMNKSLLYTMINSLVKSDYLDVTMFKGPRFRETGILDLCTYYKATNTFQFLHRLSSHPKHVFTAIIKGELSRYRRNTSSADSFKQQKKDLFDRLRKRGYGMAHIKKASASIKFSNRREALEKQKLKAQGIAPSTTKTVRPNFCTAYNPHLELKPEMLMKHWNIIEESEELNKLFPEKPRLAFRRHRKLGEHLIRAKLPPI